jgi:hypothetical protein
MRAEEAEAALVAMLMESAVRSENFMAMAAKADATITQEGGEDEVKCEEEGSSWQRSLSSQRKI